MLDRPMEVLFDFSVERRRNRLERSVTLENGAGADSAAIALEIALIAIRSDGLEIGSERVPCKLGKPILERGAFFFRETPNDSALDRTLPALRPWNRASTA